MPYLAKTRECALRRIRTLPEQRSFFKDRNWLHVEFPELVACAKADVSYCTPAGVITDRGQAGPKIVLEIGCVSSMRPTRNRGST